MEREVIGGTNHHEHKVFRAKFHPDYLLKTPTLRTRILFWLFHFNSNDIRREVAESTNIALQEGLLVPQTRVFGYKKGYVIAQREIHGKTPIMSDGYLPIKNSPLDLALSYNPNNYIESGENFHYVDLTKGAGLSAILDRKGILPQRRYRQIKTNLGFIMQKITR